MKNKNLQPSVGELQNGREDLEQRLALLQQRHAGLRERHTGLRMRYRRIQSEMRLATEGWRPPEWVRRFFEQTLSPKLRHSIRQRLITLRNCFEEDWLNLLREQYGKYRRPPQAYGMTSDFELHLLETYAREMFSGAGRIVDLGCWYGATTLSLARGLAANSRATRHRLIEAFDLFQWELWMDELSADTRLPRRYRPGESFYKDVEQLLRPYRSLVALHKQDLMEYVPSPEPIEFLFIDAMKTWGLAQTIVSRFFPLLMPGKSYVVLQDFAWFSSVVATNHLLMWRLRDHFRFVHHVPGACSVMFLCTKRTEASKLPPLTPESFTVGMVEEAYEYCAAYVSPEMTIMLEIAKLGFLIGQGHAQAAHQLMERLAASPDRLSNPMLAEVKAAVRDRRAAEFAAGGRQPAEWLSEIETWASKTLPTPARAFRKRSR